MTIKVLPANAEMMKHLKHPAGVGFREMHVPADWPADQFTFRRIVDGSILRADQQSRPPAKKPKS